MYTLIFFAALVLLIVWILNLPAFGSLPEGDRLSKIKALPNYSDGALQNLTFTPMKPEGVTYWDMISTMLKGNKNGRPKRPVPFVVPDFSPASAPKIIWFGHSTYFLQTDGLNILVDPVFSPRTSPFSFIGAKQYAGTDFVKPADFPDLDLVLLTHDHYDHLDYQSILSLKSKVKHFVVSLGVGAHLERWGIAASQITELAWNGEAVVKGLQFTALPARHFTGRKFKRNQSIWSAFVLQTSSARLYLGGDSGYEQHFKRAAEVYGPFDLAVLECGQYNTYWPFIHMFPEQTVQAALDLGAKVLLPVHWGKFTLAMHDWDDPPRRVVKKAAEENLKITMPVMGESVILGEYYPFNEWWLGLD